MSEPITIDPAPPDNPGLDFSRLKEEGIRLLQRMAGEQWTDFNEHDPGVTTLEQLAYALTELSYRAGLPVEDLLASTARSGAGAGDLPLHLPQDILPTHPWTASDYRKLLVDRIPSLANAWLIPLAPEATSEGVGGLYDILVYLPRPDCCPPDSPNRPETVVEDVRRVFCAHRNLGEDLRDVRVAEVGTVRFQGEMIIDGEVPPEEALGQAYFAAALFLAPELRRRSLRDVLAKGRTPSELFQGPLLRNGWIDDAQLRPKATEIPVRELVRAMTRSRGVQGVRALRVRVEGDPREYGVDEVIPVGEGRILRLEGLSGTNAREGEGRLRVYRAGNEVSVEPILIRREVERLEAEHRQTFDVPGELREHFDWPHGHPQDMAAYYSIQNQYPQVYGIGTYGLPDTATTERKAKAKQFKGYLLVFEQLLANAFARLACLGDDVSLAMPGRGGGPSQSLRNRVPHVEPLLREGGNDPKGQDLLIRGQLPRLGYDEGLAELVERQEPVVERRGRFLDFALALHGDDFGMHLEEGHGDPNMDWVLSRVAWLRHWPVATARRGSGIDYLESPTSGGPSGAEVRIRLTLGMEAVSHRSLTDVLGEYSLELADGEGHQGLGVSVSRFADVIEREFAKASFLTEPGGSVSGVGRMGTQPIPIARGFGVTEAFLDATAVWENYRVGTLPGEDTVSVICHVPEIGDWRLLGRYADQETALRDARAWVGSMRAVRHHTQQVYLVENTLLRFAGRDAASAPGNGSPLEFSHSVTAVFHTASLRTSGPEHRAWVRSVIRENLPAHLAVGYCPLDARGMCDFEEYYWRWRRALRGGHGTNRETTSARLAEFLRSHIEDDDR